MKGEFIMTRRIYLVVVATIITIILTISAVAKERGPQKPSEEEFGYGPRASAKALYIVKLDGPHPIHARKMYTMTALVVDAEKGEPVTAAEITIDGGMPQHGHGLPTRPR